MSTQVLSAALLASILWAQPGAVPPIPMGCPGDIAEPNDSVATAYVIPCTTQWVAPAWPVCINPIGDVDFYALNVAAGQVVASYYGGGDIFEGELSLYAPDGITLLDQVRSTPVTPSAISVVVGPAGKYFLSFRSPTAGTGQYELGVRCRAMTTPPAPVGNTLLAVKSGGNVQLAWQRSRDVELDPPTSYDVWRALPTTNVYLDPLGPTIATSFDAGPLATPTGLLLYRVRALNAAGPDGPPPSVVRFDVLPRVPRHLDPALPASVNPCASPNLDPELPFVVTVSLRDRFGVPLDGYTLELEATGGLGTFCPPGADPFRVTGTTGSAGPGRYEAKFSFSDWDLKRNPSSFAYFIARSADFGTADGQAFIRWP